MLRLSLLLEALRRGHGRLIRDLPRPPLIVHRVIVLGLYASSEEKELVHETDDSRNGSLEARVPSDSMEVHDSRKGSHDWNGLSDLPALGREAQSVVFLEPRLDAAPAASPEQATSLQGDHPEHSTSVQG